MTELTAYNKFDEEDVQLPEHIVDRTENLLSEHPMTNQRIILDTAQWWLQNVGNCPIYRWVVHHLDTLENDDVRERVAVYTEAREQAENIGLSV